MVTEDQFRRFALSLPQAEEKETWGEATFRVRDRMFASMSGRGASVKASLDDQAALLQADPETFSVPHYVGRYGWVAIDLDKVEPDMARRLLDNAWRRTAPKRVIAAYDADSAGGAPRI
jgi:hypothetical protein